WKLRRRGSFDFPVLGVAVSLKLSKDKTVEDSKIILGGVGSYPIEAATAEKIIAGKKLTEEIIREAAQAAYQPAKPLDNTDFAMTWRKEMARYYVAGPLADLANQREWRLVSKPDDVRATAQDPFLRRARSHPAKSAR